MKAGKDFVGKGPDVDVHPPHGQELQTEEDPIEALYGLLRDFVEDPLRDLEEEHLAEILADGDWQSHRT